jgi:hypothetical protein
VANKETTIKLMEYTYSNDGVNFKTVKTPEIIDALLSNLFILGILKLINLIEFNFNSRIITYLFCGVIFYYCISIIISWFVSEMDKPLLKINSWKKGLYGRTN